MASSRNPTHVRLPFGRLGPAQARARPQGAEDDRLGQAERRRGRVEFKISGSLVPKGSIFGERFSTNISKWWWLSFKPAFRGSFEDVAVVVKPLVIVRDGSGFPCCSDVQLQNVDLGDTLCEQPGLLEQAPKQRNQHELDCHMHDIWLTCWESVGSLQIQPKFKRMLPVYVTRQDGCFYPTATSCSMGLSCNGSGTVNQGACCNLFWKMVTCAGKVPNDECQVPLVSACTWGNPRGFPRFRGAAQR